MRKTFRPKGSIRQWLAGILAVALLAAAGPASGDPPATTSQPAASQPQSTAGLVPLELKLPKPAFAGTPKNIPPGTTVELAPNKPRPPFLAPRGVKNLAAGKKVTSSDEAPVIGELTMVTDGDKEAPDGHYVELGPGLQWVQIDLGEPVAIFAILIWHSHSDPRVYQDVIIKVGDDPEFKAGVVTLFNNDHDNSSKLGAGKDREYFETFEGKLIPGSRTKARFVRLYSAGCTADDLNRYTEVEVHGLPVRPAAAGE